MTKPKKPTLSKLMKEADRVFSLFIRKRDNYTCVVCGTKLNPQCGHLIKRGRKGVRFDEENCHCQCGSCNVRHNYYPEFYTHWFIKKFGTEKYSALVERSKVLKQYKVSDILEIIEKYK